MEEWAKIPAAVCANLVKTYRKRTSEATKAKDVTLARNTDKEVGRLWKGRRVGIVLPTGSERVCVLGYMQL
ncbi:hypothetical protein J4Q44_G00345470 [Coregonus suidteri]|uniref:Uncharacterized protein n=1 Tax=Coregonus suidteri TaxID=861788 RepID=A0AAN8KUV4_9TELE